MRGLRNVVAVVFAVGLFSAGGAQAQEPAIDWELDDALRQVDKQADDFDTAMASVAIQRTDREGRELERLIGTAFINEDGDLRIAATSPEARVYLMDGRDLYIYRPDNNLVEEYYLPRHPEKVMTYMRLGFAETGRDLQDDYLVSAVGERSIGDRRALGLELTPKSDKERARVNRIQLWIDEASWMPVEQVIETAASGEKLSVSYQHMARNLRLNPDLFKRNWPRGTKKQKM